MFGLPVWAFALIGLGAYELFKGGGSGSGSGGLPNPPQVPPGAAGDPSSLATAVAQDVSNSGMSYDHTLMTTFQAAANIATDGKYGPVTAGAVQYFTGLTPPAPLYSDASGFRGVTPYKP